MPNYRIVNFTIADERENICTDLCYIQWHCLNSHQNQQAFELLYQYWEQNISRQLWELGYYSDYLKCGSIVLQAAKVLGHTSVEVQLLAELGYCYMERGNLNQAEFFF